MVLVEHRRRRRARLVGAHVLAANAGELIGELTLAIEQERSVSQLGGLVHVYPTIASSIQQVGGAGGHRDGDSVPLAHASPMGTVGPAPVTLERLSNERWGFSSNCFVCEPTNILAAFGPHRASCSPHLPSSPPPLRFGVVTRLHCLLDAATSNVGRPPPNATLAVTATFRSEFHHPIRVGKRYRLEAAIGERSDSTLEATSAHRRRPGPCADFRGRDDGRPLGGAGGRRRSADGRLHAGLSFAVTGARRAAALAGAALAGYLAGTFPSADVASRLATGGKVDLRRAGTGNPGAMNAAQQLGRGGDRVLVADAAKGALGAGVGRARRDQVAHMPPRQPPSPATSLQCGRGFEEARELPRRQGRASPCSPPTSRSTPQSPLLARPGAATRRPPCGSRRRCGWPPPCCGGGEGGPILGPRADASGSRCSQLAGAGMILAKFATAASSELMNVAIVTDSNTMIPWPLVRRLGITVVPLTVTIGGEELVEDEQLDVADDVSPPALG